MWVAEEAAVRLPGAMLREGRALLAVRVEWGSTGRTRRKAANSAMGGDIHSIHRGLCTLGAAESAGGRLRSRESSMPGPETQGAGG